MLQLEESEQHQKQVGAELIGALVGFILGYLTWGVFPSWPLIAKIFTECFL